MSYREIPEDKILKFPATPGFSGWKSFFTEDSITHPAKMNLNLLRHIIETYTELGDIILDPMAGTGSTIILASLLGRHGIAVEYEQRFCEMVRENIKRTERQASFTPKGKMLCIQGDARELSKLLKELDTIITSPPYSKSCSGDSRRELWERMTKDPTSARYGRESHPLTGTQYSTDPNNIGNLPHGDLDAIITSPPYSESMSGRNPFSTWSEEVKRKWWGNYRSQGGGLSYEGFIKLMEKQEYSYSVDPQNIGNLKHGEIDAIITSPPYGSDNANLRERKDKSAMSVLSTTGVRAVPLEEDNIGVLEYGGIDAIVTSPPYSQISKPGNIKKPISKEEFEKRKEQGDNTIYHDIRPERKGTQYEYYEMIAIETYGDNKNIDRLPHGDIEAIITSPPYEGSYLGGGDQEARRKRLIEAGYDAKDFFGGKARDTILKHYDEVDTIVTSPPYEAGFEGGSRHHKKDGEIYRIMDEKALPISYASQSEEGQIGNKKSESYLEAMLQCYREFYKVLKNSGKLILVTKNFIRDKAVVRLDEDTIKLCEASGFTLKDRWFFRLPQISFWRILYEKKFPDAPKLLYEDVLIFEKRGE